MFCANMIVFFHPCQWLTHRLSDSLNIPNLPNWIYQTKSTKPNQIEPLKPNVNSETLIFSWNTQKRKRTQPLGPLCHCIDNAFIQVFNILSTCPQLLWWVEGREIVLLLGGWFGSVGGLPGFVKYSAPQVLVVITA